MDVDTINREIEMPDLTEVLKTALALEIRDRAALAERLLASLDELNEEEADFLWAEEAQRRLQEYRAGRAAAVSSSEVAKKAERLFR
jgi:putative addiction module component (TIGR02574 family)